MRFLSSVFFPLPFFRRPVCICPYVSLFLSVFYPAFRRSAFLFILFAFLVAPNVVLRFSTAVLIIYLLQKQRFSWKKHARLAPPRIRSEKLRNAYHRAFSRADLVQSSGKNTNCVVKKAVSRYCDTKQRHTARAGRYPVNAKLRNCPDRASAAFRCF